MVGDYISPNVPGLFEGAKDGLGGVKRSRKALVTCRAYIISFWVIAK